MTGLAAASVAVLAGVALAGDRTFGQAPEDSSKSNAAADGSIALRLTPAPAASGTAGPVGGESDAGPMDGRRSKSPWGEPDVRADLVNVDVPETGSGAFVIASLLARQRPSKDATGPVISYTVEIEREVPVGVRSFARSVVAVLTDRRGWAANGSHVLRQTDGPGDFRILLATPDTTDALCAPLETGGRLSCRNGELVVLNAWRWVHGAPAYRDDLMKYRKYMLNHEVGHALGSPHEQCPGAGELAPVMVQQTKGLGGCLPNPWPNPL